MRVSASAVAAGIVATALAAVGHAAHPARLVVGLAAGCAFLAALSEARAADRSDWLSVRLLLALNLVVAGVTDAARLGARSIVSTLSSVMLGVAAIGSHHGARSGPGTGDA